MAFLDAAVFAACGDELDSFPAALLLDPTFCCSELPPQPLSPAKTIAKNANKVNFPKIFFIKRLFDLNYVLQPQNDQRHQHQHPKH